MDTLELIEHLRQLNQQRSDERDYALYAEIIRQVCKAKSAIIVSTSPTPAIKATALVSDAWSSENFNPEYIGLFQRASSNGFSHTRFRSGNGVELLILAIKMAVADNLFILLEMSILDFSIINEMILRGMLAVNTSAVTERIRNVEHISSDILKWTADVLKQNNFGSAILTLVNEAITCLPADFVALIWITNSRPEVKAISNIDKFDKNNNSVILLEDIAAEVLAYNETLNWKIESQDFDAISNLRLLCENSGYTRATAYPMRDSNGVITSVLITAYRRCDKEQSDYFMIPVALDMMQAKLNDQYKSSLTIFARIINFGKRILVDLLGPEDIWYKGAGILAFVLLFLSLVIYWPYRVVAGATLQTDSTRILSAPIDGRIVSVHATAGDSVKSMFVIASLDTHDLRLQEMEAADQISRFNTEVSKYRADGDLANAEISDAKLKEAISKKSEIDYYIANADLKAPMDCIIVEGEKRELLGAPVKKGEQLFKLAKIENIYASLTIPESEIKEIPPNASGRLALLSQPGKSIFFHIKSIIPVSQVNNQEGAKFEAIATIDDAPQTWWRPGMTGAAKIDTGNRQVFWIFTHKIVDLLLLKILY